MKKILIVEDDKKIAQLEQAYLEMSGYETFCVYDGADVEAEAEKNQYDLILLDLMLPNCSGHTICENLRKKSDIPILMVTALGESVDVIRGLGLGADDYITKPFDPAQLVARVKAHLERYERIWGYDYESDAATVSVHINRIREKIEKEPKKPKIIDTVWGVGYRLNN